MLLEGTKAGYPTTTETPAGGEPSPSLPESPQGSGESSEEGEHTAPSDTSSQPVVPEQPTSPSLPEEPSQSVASQVVLDFTKVDLVGKEFLNKWEVVIEKDFGEVVSLEDTLKFTVKIKHKVTGELFHGTLNQPLLVIANNTNVSLTPVSTVLVTRGQAEIKITPKKVGNTYLALNLGTAKIGNAIINIQ
ncbi:MAG: hypothetical protein LBU27_08360 [Candidatus Peribacteria bacterium]|nr:hypothetical protein [Candidatus Peribacteria bacterium]